MPERIPPTRVETQPFDPRKITRLDVVLTAKELDNDGRWLDGLTLLLEGFAVALEGLTEDQRAWAFNYLGYKLRTHEYAYSLSDYHDRNQFIRRAVSAATFEGDNDEASSR